MVRSLFPDPKRQNPVFQGSLQMAECFWNASSFARPRNGRIMVQQIKCQNPVGWFKMQKKLDSYPATGFLEVFCLVKKENVKKVGKSYHLGVTNRL